VEVGGIEEGATLAVLEETEVDVPIEISVDDLVEVVAKLAVLIAALELLTALELLLLDLSPPELPPQAVSTHSNEHTIPIVTFFM
jgi:hypothetical protein